MRVLLDNGTPEASRLSLLVTLLKKREPAGRTRSETASY